MTCHSVNPNNPYEIYKLPHISPRFRTKCYYLPVVLNKQRILYKNQLLTISRKKERERSSFLALGLLSIFKYFHEQVLRRAAEETAPYS